MSERELWFRYLAAGALFLGESAFCLLKVTQTDVGVASGFALWVVLTAGILTLFA